MRNRVIPTVVLLLLVALAASAQEGVALRNCRAGVISEGQARAGAARRVASEDNKYIGDRRQLVVLASFSDQQFEEEDPLPKWNRVFNEERFSEEPFCGSIHDYFYDQSYGQLNLTFDLFHVRLDESRLKYASTSVNDENSQYLVNDIADVLETLGIEWAQYDWDGDRQIDQLLIVYAGQGQNAGGGSSTIWPHQWWLSWHIKDSSTGEKCEPRGVGADSGEEYYIDSYCAVQEIINLSTVKSSFGTICHEYSHCLGMPDFYYAGTKFLGSWDLMDYGNNNGSGYRPCNYSAHERMYMGWLQPVELSEATRVKNLAAIDEMPQAYLIRNDGYASEFYMVENRQQQGWDASLPASGVLIFHIDFDEDLWTGVINQMANTSSKQHYIIIPANNNSYVSNSKNWPYPYNNNNALTNTSSPAATLFHENIDGTKLMSKPLTNIAVADGLASFDFMASETAVTVETAPQHLAAPSVYDLCGRRIAPEKKKKGLYISGNRKLIY